MADPLQSTKLEAVNVLLATIGQSPISTLIGSGLGHANFAISTLDEVSRRVQAMGWACNTEYDYPLTPNGEGHLVPPNNTLRIDQMEKHDWHYDFIFRDGKMYDRKSRTYVFTETDFTFRLLLAFDFEKLPEHLRNFITIKAARLFQERILGSDTLHTFTADDEADALKLATEADTDNRDLNVLMGTDTYDILNRWI